MKASIYELGPGKFRIVYDAPPGPDGRRRQKTLTISGSKKEAQKKRVEILHRLQTGDYVDPARTTVAEFLEQWLRDHASANCSRKTHQEYADKIRLYVVPHIGGLALQQLKPAHLVAMYAVLRTSGRKRPIRRVPEGGLPGEEMVTGLAERSLLHIHRILHKAFSQAVMWEQVLRNPCDAVQAPRPQKVEMQILQSDQLETLLRTAKEDCCYSAILLAVSTGMRLGEICGLKWDDIDFAGGYLSVRRSLEYTYRTGVRLKLPKTPSSVRRIDLPRETLAQLMVAKGEQAQRRILLGPAYENSDLVCCRPDGQFFRPDYVSYTFSKLLVAAGLPHVRFHDLRHSHATWLLKSGVHPKVVQERLCHGNIAITLDTYSHVLPSMQEDAARRIDDLLRAALPK